MKFRELQKDFGKLVITLLGAFAAAVIGSLFTFSSIPTWYANLEKTVITPPSWVFGPAWTVLYILMAIAAFLVWRVQDKKSEVKEAMQLYGLQLILNALWSILFFGAHLMLTAYVEILFLLLTIVMTTIWYHRVNKVAAYLMIPYILWVSFASVLNLMTYLVNK